MLTDDRAVQTVSAAREELEPAFRVLLPPRDIVPAVEDKTSFHELAEREGLPVPRSVVLRDLHSLPLLDRLTPPLVIKPASKAFVLNSDIERAVRVDTLEQAREVVEQRVERARGLLAQEWIDGPDTEIHFTLFVCDAQGAVTAYFQGRKVVCEPPRIGSTAVCTEARDPTGELQRLTPAVHREGRLRRGGGAGAETRPAKRAVRHRRAHGGAHGLAGGIATLCGVNIPARGIPDGAPAGLRAAARGAEPVAWRASRAHRPPPGELPAGARPGRRLLPP